MDCRSVSHNTTLIAYPIFFLLFIINFRACLSLRWSSCIFNVIHHQFRGMLLPQSCLNQWSWLFRAIHHHFCGMPFTKAMELPVSSFHVILSLFTLSCPWMSFGPKGIYPVIYCVWCAISPSFHFRVSLCFNHFAVFLQGKNWMSQTKTVARPNKSGGVLPQKNSTLIHFQSLILSITLQKNQRRWLPPLP